MKVLVVNAGSSSLKFTFFRMRNEAMLATGIVERIGLKEPRFSYKRHDGVKYQSEATVADHDDALRMVCRKLIDPEYGVLTSLSEVEAIGHRVVHGAEKFSDSVLVTPEVKTAIRLCATLAPLHNPPNLGGIEACERVFPGVPNIAVFDTAFHQSMPAKAYMYAIPYKLYQEYGIRKYGFHGTSHKFVGQATAEFLGKSFTEAKLITCHLGNGCSVAAIDRGEVLDTSMGMTPLMGLIMGTRCGDIDPGVVLNLLKRGMSADEIDILLNKKSGLRGIAEIGSGDMRDILAAAEDNNPRARCALDMFVHRLVFYIGGYQALLGGADALVLTGGIGENCLPIRRRLVTALSSFNCVLDPETGETVGKPELLTTAEASLPIVVMPTNEELMIGRETMRVLNK